MRSVRKPLGLLNLLVLLPQKRLRLCIRRCCARGHGRDARHLSSGDLLRTSSCLRFDLGETLGDLFKIVAAACGACICLRFEGGGLFLERGLRNCTVVSAEFTHDVLAHFDAVISRHRFSPVTFGFRHGEPGNAKGEAVVAMKEMEKKG